MTFWFVFIVSVIIIFGSLFYGLLKFFKWGLAECKKNIIAYKILKEVREEKKNPIYLHEKSGRMNKRKYQESVRHIEKNVVAQHTNNNLGNLLLVGYLAYMFTDRQFTMRQFNEVTGLQSFSDELIRKLSDPMYDNISCDFIVHKTLNGQYSYVPHHSIHSNTNDDYMYRAEDYVDKERFNGILSDEPIISPINENNHHENGFDWNDYANKQFHENHWSDTQNQHWSENQQPHWTETQAQEPHWTEIQRQEQEQRELQEQQWSWQNNQSMTVSDNFVEQPSYQSYGNNDQTY